MAESKTKAPVQSEKGSGIRDLFIVALTIFSLLMVAAYYLLPLTEATKETLLWLDIPISLIFLVDSFHCLRQAPDKRAYLKWGWLDFLGSIPLIFPLRIARLGRLIRIWRTLRLRRLNQVGDDLDQNRAQAAALITVLLAIMVLTTATVAVLEFESEVPEANIRSGLDALWWSIVTMATVGYGDYYPITTAGRIAAVALMTVGVGIFGVLASFLANLFLPETADDGEAPAGSGAPSGAGDPALASIQAEIEAVNTRQASIQAEIETVNARLDTIQALLNDRELPPPGEPGT